VIRLVLLLGLIVLVIATLMPRLRTLIQRPSPRAARHDELVKDPVCQTYVLLSRAVHAEVGGATVHFCSRDCAERYRRGDRRA